MNWVFGVGLARIELATSALSVLRSNRLSYSPRRSKRLHHVQRVYARPAPCSGQGRTTNDWLAVAKRAPSCDHKWATPCA